MDLPALIELGKELATDMSQTLSEHSQERVWNGKQDDWNENPVQQDNQRFL